VIAARLLTAWYFIHFLLVLPLLGIFETPRPRPASITDAVLGPGAGGAAPAGSTAAPETRG